MCGIAGIVSWTRPTEQAELRAMTDRLRHRGPDGHGEYFSGPVALGHTRLSIIDVAGGAQPMGNEDGCVQVVFNGEIFNHVELRRELQAHGHRFATHCDTEVLVHAYEQYGDDFLHRLNGQFAIALWDQRRQRLLLARDRVGIRPLFYCEAGGRLAFASEIKALFALPELPRRLNPAALGEIFTFWAPLSSHTVFDGIHSLEPGHCMVVQSQGQRIRRYWDWQFPQERQEPSGSAQLAAGELRELLLDAVRLRLRADVPVAAYLSGGLDSSIIAALVHRCTDTPLRTFSLTFDDAEFDEGPAQREMAQYLGCQHSALHCSRADIAAAFPQAIWHAESPILRTAPVPLMLLAQQVRAAGYKVVLTGEGADEVFGGYDLFKEAAIRRFMARAPQSTWRAALLARLYPYLEHSPTANPALAKRFFGDGAEQLGRPGFGHLPRWQTTRRLWRFLSPALRAQMSGSDPLRIIAADLPDQFQRWPPLSQDQYIEAHTLMSGYLLSAQGDRMAMSQSIEGRFPYLDHRLIEFANRLPPRYKLMGLKEKYLLKCSAAGLLPESIRKRPKQPYRAPDSQSFFERGEPVDYAAELLSPRRLHDAGYFDTAAVTKLFDKCRAGRAIGFGDNMAFVGILSTMLVHQQFIRDEPPPVRRERPTSSTAN